MIMLEGVDLEEPPSNSAEGFSNSPALTRITSLDDIGFTGTQI